MAPGRYLNGSLTVEGYIANGRDQGEPISPVGGGGPQSM